MLVSVAMIFLISHALSLLVYSPTPAQEGTPILLRGGRFSLELEHEVRHTCTFNEDPVIERESVF